MKKHKCHPIANFAVQSPRRMWLGEVDELPEGTPIDETHCLHISPDGQREFVLFLNHGDGINLRIVSGMAIGPNKPDDDWYQGYAEFARSDEKLGELRSQIDYPSLDMMQ